MNLFQSVLLLTASLYSANSFSAVAPPSPSSVLPQQPASSFDPQLIRTLGHQNFEVLRDAVDPHVLQECSRQAVRAYEQEGGHKGTYLEKPWKSSRIYIDGGKLWTPKDASFMDPLISQARQLLATQLGLVGEGQVATPEELEQALPLESAFCNYYFGDVTDSSIPRDMANHVDCNWQGTPVPLSVVIQGIYEPEENEKEILGVLDCQDYLQQQPRQAVGLTAGDALVLAKAYHQPRPVPDHVRRMVFVLFFSELNFVP